MSESSFYLEIIKEVQTLINQGKMKEALSFVEQELAMPYVPQSVEGKLHQFRFDILEHINQSIKTTVKDPNDLWLDLAKQPVIAIAALQQIKALNCRPYVRQIQDFFLSANDELIKALLMEICIEQQLSTNFQILKDNLNIDFIPFAIPLPQESDGFSIANQLLVEWLENENPSFLKIAQSVLVQECLMALPFSYEDIEGFYLAASVLRYVCYAFDDANQWQNWVKKLTIEEPQCWDLAINAEFSTL